MELKPLTSHEMKALATQPNVDMVQVNLKYRDNAIHGGVNNYNDTDHVFKT